jgi:hypothetical protein
LRAWVFPPRAPMRRICSMVWLNKKGMWVNLSGVALGSAPAVVMSRIDEWLRDRAAEILPVPYYCS